MSIDLDLKVSIRLRVTPKIAGIIGKLLETEAARTLESARIQVIHGDPSAVGTIILSKEIFAASQELRVMSYGFSLPETWLDEIPPDDRFIVIAYRGHERTGIVSTHKTAQGAINSALKEASPDLLCFVAVELDDGDWMWYDEYGRLGEPSVSE